MELPENVTVGRHTYLCNPQFRGNMTKVLIGNFTSIAEGCVFDCGFQHKQWITTFPMTKLTDKAKSNVMSKGDIQIGNDVWIGEGCTIMSGVQIGDGCIVGAGEVVRYSIPPYTTFKDGKWWSRNMVMASHTRNEEIVRKLVEIAWWNWSDEKIIENMELLQSENVEEFIGEFYDNRAKVQSGS